MAYTSPLFILNDADSTSGSLSYKYPVVNTIGVGSNPIDVVNNFSWRNIQSNNTEINSEVPSIQLTEYKLTKGKWLQNLSNVWEYLKNVSSVGSIYDAPITDSTAGMDPYQQLYTGMETGFIYNFPYFVGNAASVTGNIKNTWKPVELSNIPFFGGYIEKGKDVASMFSTGFGFEPPSFFGNTSKRSISISFPLYNTVSLKNTKDNFYLCQLLQLQNVKTKTSFLTHIAPSLYLAEGLNFKGLYMPAAYMSSLDVKSIGTTRSVDIGDGKACLIPEAYKIEITLESLMEDSVNILSGSFSDSNKVKVIIPPTPE